MTTGGTSVTFLKRRLAEIGRKDLLQAVEGGLLSAYAAAEAAGLVTRRPTTGTGTAGPAQRRQHIVRQVTSGDPHPAAVAMELALGPSPHFGSHFRTREELRHAWEAHREGLLQRATPGRRPAGWWEFEAPFPYPGYDVERSTLWRRGKLSMEERAFLEREWREAFEECHAPDFAISRPWPEGLLEGVGARREHLAWADVPSELIKRWTAERKARAKR
jgi:hypothetical protein